MAFSVEKMKDDKLLVKKIAACERLAFTNYVCTSKTGILTDGKLSVEEFFIGSKNYVVTEDPSLRDMNQDLRALLIDCIIMNNDAQIDMTFDRSAGEAIYDPIGNSTDVAMLNFLYDNNVDVRELLSKRQRESEIECVIPFSPVRKRSVTVIRPSPECGYVRVVVKGAPEYVIGLCTRYKSKDNEDQYFDEGFK
jgi:magnesium-transporting ATPase (P-type)